MTTRQAGGLAVLFVCLAGVALAQDVEAVLGDGYNVLGIGGDKDRTLSLRGTDLIAPMVKAIQEQQATIKAQQAQIEAKDARLADMENQQAAQQGTIERQQAEIEALKSELGMRQGQDRRIEDLAHRLELLEARSKAGAEQLR